MFSIHPIIRLFPILRLFFPKIPPSDKEWKRWRHMRNKQLVQQYTNGNVRLQMGHYMTEPEFEIRKAAVLSYRF